MLVHVRTNGKTHRLEIDGAQNDPAARAEAMLRDVEHQLGLSRGALDDHAVDWRDDVVVIRPWAVWG